MESWDNMNLLGRGVADTGAAGIIEVCRVNVEDKFYERTRDKGGCKV
jgi:hypothetical protein